MLLSKLVYNDLELVYVHGQDLIGLCSIALVLIFLVRFPFYQFLLVNSYLCSVPMLDLELMGFPDLPIDLLIRRVSIDKG